MVKVCRVVFISTVNECIGINETSCLQVIEDVIDSLETWYYQPSDGLKKESCFDVTQLLSIPRRKSYDVTFNFYPKCD